MQVLINNDKRQLSRSARRAAVVPVVVVSLVIIVGFAALTIDSGRMYVTRNELQNAADAGALAAAQAIPSTSNQSYDYPSVQAAGYQLASGVSVLNICQGAGIKLTNPNVTFGRLEKPENLADPFLPGAAPYNAVRVVAQRTQGSPNGPLDLTLARFWGMNTTNVSATAVAVLEDRASGYRPLKNTPNGAGGTLIPFTMKKSIFDTQAESGPDQFKYNKEAGQVIGGPDSIREVHLYPNSDENGNFGLLNIGNPSQSQGLVASQITNGVTKADLIAEVGVPELMFITDSGEAKTYTMTGTAGMKASLEPDLEARLGQVVGFGIHTSATQSGANIIYTVVGIRYGRIMEVMLNGKNKRIVIQPVFYSGSDVVTNPAAPSTDSYVSRIRLAR